MRHWLGLPTSVHSQSSDQGKRDTKVNLNKRILMISSISGLVNMTPQRQVAYNASKGGLTMAAKVCPALLHRVYGFETTSVRSVTVMVMMDQESRLTSTVIGR